MTIEPPELLITTIRNNFLFFKKDAKIVFVCGRDITSPSSKRKIVLDFAKRNIPSIHLLLAEEFFKNYSNSDVDILTIEKELSEYADCILIVLESESAFCELGAFAVDDGLAKKMLLINDINFKNSSSFINNGPIKKIEASNDDFSGILYVNMESILSCAGDLKKYFLKLTSRRQKRTNFNDFLEIERNVKGRMLFLCDIVGLLSPVTYRELIILLALIYGNKNFNFLRIDLDMLCTLKMLHRKKHNNEFYYIRNESGMKFLNLNFTTEVKIRSQVSIAYRKRDPYRLYLLGGAHERTP